MHKLQTKLDDSMATLEIAKDRVDKPDLDTLDAIDDLIVEVRSMSEYLENMFQGLLVKLECTSQNKGGE